MKIFGSLKEMVSAVFRKDTHEVTLRPNQTVGLYTGPVDVQLPAKNGNAVLVSSGDIVNADIAAGAAIAGSKIQAANGTTNAGVVSTGAQDLGGVKTFLSNPVMSGLTASQAVVTDASKNLASLNYGSTNTASTLVQRDVSGNFAAGTITANLTGNASGSAGSFTGSLVGDVSGTQGATSVDKIKGKAVSTTAPTDAQTLVWNNSTSQYVPVSISGDVTMTNAGNIQIANGAIVNVDVSASASIAGTKIAPDFGAQNIKTIGNVDTNTISATGSATLRDIILNGTSTNGFIEMTGQTVGSVTAPSATTKAKLFAGSDGKLYGYNGTGSAPFAIGSGGSGSGEINAVSNSSAADDTTGWAAGTSHTVARDTSNSPLSGIVSTSFGLSSSAAIALGSQTSTSGVYDAITLPSGLLNRKLKVEFYYTTPASSAGTWAVALYQGSTKLALSTDSSGDTILPSGVTGGKFTAYFDSSSSASYSLNLVQRARTGANTLYITNVVCGPGIQPQGAVVGEWQSYTPTATNFTVGNGTLTGLFRRVGSNAEIRIDFNSGTTSTYTTTDWKFSLPSGLTWLVPSNVTARNVFGTATGEFNDGSNGESRNGLVTGLNPDVTSVYIKNAVSTLDYTNLGWNSATTGVNNSLTNTRMSLNFTVPIAEWAGSGTLTVAQNDVEYAYNTNATNTASDTASFGYGPNGSLIPNGAVGTEYVRRVRFQTPAQVGDTIVVETDAGTSGASWINMQARFPNMSQSGSTYGVRVDYVSGSTTDLNVRFAANGYLPDGATYGANGAAWSLLSTWRWRVRKSSAGAAVGFGIVAPGTSAGLVSASGLPGNTTGNAIASGFVGQRVFSNSTSVSLSSTTNFVNLQSITLDKGLWLVTSMVDMDNAASCTGHTQAISVNSGNTTTDQIRGVNQLVVATAANTSTSSCIASYYLNITSDSTVVYQKARASGATTTAAASIQAIRIA